MDTEQPTHQESGGDPPAVPPEQEPIPRGQKFFDNIWLLLLISLGISLLFYNAWGIANLLSVPWVTP